MNSNHTTARTPRTRVRGGAWPLGLVLAAAVALAGCDLEVTNPQNIAETDLFIPTSIPGLVLGAISDFGLGMNEGGACGTVCSAAYLTDEVSHVGSYVGLLGLANGENRDDWVESQLRWGYPAKARWIANNATVMVSDILEEAGEDPNSNVDIATTRMIAGFANRVLGDTFCEATRDGGPREDFRVYYEEAEERFTQAITVAQAALANAELDEHGEPIMPQGSRYTAERVILAAYAGRAQVREMMAGLNGDQAMRALALADAAMVPTEFQYEQVNNTAGRNINRQNNWLRARAEASIWGTPFYEWDAVNWSHPTQQGDHRLRYNLNANTAGEYRLEDAPLGLDNRRPYLPPRKWLGNSDNIPVAGGRHARLIEAEAAVLDGDYQTLVDKINEVREYRNATQETWWRNDIPLITEVPTTPEAAWYMIIKERGIEFWLEGQRLQDLRRWQVTPGEAFVRGLQEDGVGFDVVRYAVRGEPWWADFKVSVYDVDVRLCVEVAQNEKLANPNY